MTLLRHAGSKVSAVLPDTVQSAVGPIWSDIIERTHDEFIGEPTEKLMIAPSGVCNLGCKFCAYRHKDRPKRLTSSSA